MAFAASNKVVASLGNAWLTTGTWTASAGDTAGTVTVPGQVVLSAVFQPNLASGGPTEDPAWSYSASSGVSTVTVYHHQTITAGRFAIISK